MRLALEEVATGLRGPLYVTAPPDDDRLFIVEQSGRVLVLTDPMTAAVRVGGRGSGPDVFLDLSEVVSVGNERGLLGLAFHPEYASNGRFFVHYTDGGGDTALVEYAVSDDPDVASSAPVAELLSADQPASNHNGGMLAFGPDGMLYLALGDGGGAGDQFGNGQRPDTLLGTILRVDVDGGAPYEVPADNPFADGGDGAREVWHYGLRNPWRFSFDEAEGLLYIADVGQNAFEEVNVVPADASGLNFGWPITEGNHCFDPPQDCSTAGLTLPVFEYPTDEGCAVIGGYVYRGEAIPQLHGHYLYADVCGGFVRSFRHEDGQVTDERDWTDQLEGLSAETGESVSGYAGPTSFGLDAAGELYLTTAGGSVFRIVPAS
ncbi:MAG: PQQ-dependent sugar dehydrogenase [Actinobacteria bacterium]|nr:PQQ-dependent sugar dehydrogenase [Actinomycetota bacterium]